MQAERTLIVTAFVVAEVDYLVGERLGQTARREFLGDLAAGDYEVVCLEPADYSMVEEIEKNYAALNLGLADAAVILMAARYGTRRLLTFDSRDFRAVRPLQGGSFELLPDDL